MCYQATVNMKYTRNNLAASGNVDYVTNTKEYAGQQADKSEMQKPK